MQPEPLDTLPLWAFFLATVVFVYAAVEGGIWLGRYRKRVSEAERETTIGPIVGATMGLLAFMLAFTFGLAASRYDARRKAAVDEANAVGTTYLRAGFLAEPQRAEVRSLLRRYVAERLSVVETGDIDRLLVRSSDVHRALWSQAEAAMAADSHSIATGLFVETLNETIDMHATRILVAVRSRVPIILWITLYLSAFFSMLQLGYQAGLAGSRRSPAVVALTVTFSIVLLLIADLDRPRDGLIRVSQQAMIELQESWKDEPAESRNP